MIIEYSFYDTASNEAETKEALTKINKFHIDTLSVLPVNLKLAKNILQSSHNTHTSLSCPIDYPLGILDTKSRSESILFAIKNGAKIIDMVCPVYFLCNRKYDKFREDIKNSQILCLESGASLRYILEYRIYSYELLYKVAQILLEYNINTIYPSTGYMLDDINDNILAAALINKKLPETNIICNGNFWTDAHAKLVLKANLFGIRVNSLNALEILYKNIPK
jgi:deoxyribose-phosphate aldolase